MNWNQPLPIIKNLMLHFLTELDRFALNKIPLFFFFFSQGLEDEVM